MWFLKTPKKIGADNQAVRCVFKHNIYKYIYHINMPYIFICFSSQKNVNERKKKEINATK